MEGGGRAEAKGFRVPGIGKDLESVTAQGQHHAHRRLGSFRQHLFLLSCNKVRDPKTPKVPIGTAGIYICTIKRVSGLGSR
jgi:hypothetical protein